MGLLFHAALSSQTLSESNIHMINNYEYKAQKNKAEKILKAVEIKCTGLELTEYSYVDSVYYFTFNGQFKFQYDEKEEQTILVDMMKEVKEQTDEQKINQIKNEVMIVMVRVF